LFFNEIEGKAAWQRLEENATDDLGKDLAFLLDRLAEAGYVDGFRVNTTRPPGNIPVVKILVCGLKQSWPQSSRREKRPSHQTKV
jgi:ribosomal protein S12 methylthiotransferase accessory factor YcaO